MKIYSSILPAEALQEDVKKEFPQVSFEFHKGINEELFLNAEIFLTYGEDLTEELIYKADKLKWIMVMSAGLDRMPFEACKKRGILVTNVRGIHKIPMAEFTIGMMLQHVKQMRSLWTNEQAKAWERKLPMGELYGKTLLILGIGAIGGEVARLAKAFNMKTIGVNRSGREAEWADEIYTMDNYREVMPEADFIVSVMPSTNETKHFLDASDFEIMKDTAVLINIGRGDLVKDEVLIVALQEKKIAHAYLDVFYEEPLKESHPFWMMENVTVTPHISSLTKNYLPRSLEIFKHNLHTYIKKGSGYLNVIDMDRGY
ncbi:D-2-hydroxyacid dehydrogenase [Mesobacillus selenatarsenatis]|uniref:D-3-phosphoglycerate dehydrogenase n=1 Tax=Mesobacillus selenatarsenatis (strain DSM 18680 / JCM 14380 / FERM P-15431 / SF-1) TaxID=1321606 RepID=A0A0A8X7V8_MESS1|nr:D-2-hydroxyacid dehydrogenase [Mesobacillus selenatarsenatis]GAM15993.1 D-3-phosphoglycerate dehydrogenase [Mesobacillus selenatarsenatis SF-1]